jgi:hypothetical protein
MACQIELKNKGEAYPRTCEDCGLELCKKGLIWSGGISPTSLPASVFVVRNRATGMAIVTASLEDAEKFGDLMDGEWEEAPCISFSTGPSLRQEIKGPLHVSNQSIMEVKDDY